MVDFHAAARTCVVSLVLALVVPPALAIRVEFEFVKPDGERLSGAEVCFFPAAPDARTPYEKYLWSDVVKCSDADQIIAVPPGRWNYFGRHASGWITNARLYMVVSGDREQFDGGYKRLRTDIAPAAAVNVEKVVRTLGTGEHLVLYFPSSVEKMSHVLAVPPNTVEILVPADEEFLPLIVRRGLIKRVGELHRARTQTEAAVRVPAKSRIIVSYSTFERPPDDFEGPLPAPVITFTRAEIERYRAVVPKEIVGPSDLVIFQDLTPGNGVISAEGRYLTMAPRAVSVPQTHEVTVIEPLALQPAGSLEVSYFVPAFHVATTGECRAVAGSELPDVTLRIRRCYGSECSTVAQREIGESKQSNLSFEGLAAGDYRAELILGKSLIGRSLLAQVRAYRGTHASVDANHSTVSGVVSRGNSHVPAALDFRGVTVTTTNDGWYSAIVPDINDTRSVTVKPCDSECVYIVGLDTRDTTIDIALPESDLRVKVVESATDKPLPDAVTHLNRASATGEVELSVSGPVTDTTGIAAFCGSPLGKPFVVCADKLGYKMNCVPVADPSRLPHEVVVKLDKHETLTRGRIRSPIPLQMATVFFVDMRRGLISETARVAEDATFTMEHPHVHSETVILVARNAPLAILARNPSATQDGEIIWNVPGGNVRQIEVRPAPDLAAILPISISIGGVPVPARVIALHQALRREQAAVSPRVTVNLSVLESGPLEILRGFERRPPDLGTGDEFIDVRYAAGHQRLPVPPDASTVTIR